MFAKLFDSQKGQILVKVDSNPDDGHPEVRFYCEPKGLGVSSIAVGFGDSDEGWEVADRFFESVDQSIAEEYACAVFDYGF